MSRRRVACGGATYSWTYTPSTANVESVTDNGDGTYTWILTGSYSPGNYQVNGKYGSTWTSGSDSATFTI